MIAFLQSLFRWKRRSSTPSVETRKALSTADQMIARFDERQRQRHEDVKATRLEQMRLRQDIRRDPITDTIRGVGR